MFSGVNCTKADLPDIETARADVKYGNWYIEDQKQQGEWDGTASMYDMTIRWTNKHVVIVKIVFFLSATTVTRLARTSRKTTELFYTLTTSNALRQNLGIQLRSHTPVNVIHLSILLDNSFFCRVSLHQPSHPAIRAQSRTVRLEVNSPARLSTSGFRHRTDRKQHQGDVQVQAGRDLQQI